MQKITAILSVVLAIGLATTAFAKPITDAQVADLKELSKAGRVTRAQLEGFLIQHRAAATTYTVKRLCRLKDAIKAGKYDWVNNHITPENFPVPDVCRDGVEVTVTLFSPQELGQEDGVITTQEAEVEMGDRKCQAVDWTVLLPLGAKYPELQREFWIVGLGSRWQRPGGRVHVPVLFGGVGERYLHLHWVGPDYRWRSYVRLAASCK